MTNTDTIKGPSFSLKNRLTRLVWNVVYACFFRFTPNPMHSWRAFILRLFGAKIGKGVHVYPKVKIWGPWNLVLDDECGIANGVTLYSQGLITIGKRTVISQGAHLVAGTHDYTKLGFPLFTKSIIIGDNVWLAAEAFIHPGIKIGNGAVIGARSVVTKNQPEWMVCSGHPCIPIKKRVLEGLKK
ncbi:putative colanic acid biosynthesis acetyltransferase WcaF [Flaviramulus basaltis]|uniref:Putative colanic acid biosynthesis acetyltransferase WcaF n=1 Tax=Flaviramulus basaltis TaxID=369401 RepID=A0A1K2INL5_9FLAO|nr:DapH/DapD/GlmU-related protein [Flaviramulus basaltis]SFZ94036.1 putative colanic acid biosynthesis acetyltransferase WcaF [Flaviramulus basaltis]